MQVKKRGGREEGREGGDTHLCKMRIKSLGWVPGAAQQQLIGAVLDLR